MQVLMRYSWDGSETPLSASRFDRGLSVTVTCGGGVYHETVAMGMQVLHHRTMPARSKDWPQSRLDARAERFVGVMRAD